MEVQVAGRALPLACASWSFAILPLAKAARVIRAIGFSRIDIGFSHLRIESYPSPFQQGRALRNELEAEGLAMSDLFPALPFETNDGDGARRRQNRGFFEEIIGFAAGCGSPGITLKPGVRQQSQEDEGWGLCLEVLGDYCALARAAGLRLSVEPHLDSIVENPERARNLVEILDGLRITLDYSHFVALGCRLSDVRTLHPRTAHLHVRQARKDRVQSPAEGGTIPVKRILEDLVADGYTGIVAMEYQNSDWQGCNDIDVVSETVKNLRELGVSV